MSDMDAAEYFENAMERFRQRYFRRRFFTERDVVWTLQQRLASDLGSSGASYRVYHTVMPRIRTDLAILSGETIEVAVEFKYEPSHRRRADHGGDIWPTKFDVVAWAEVQRDVQRIREFVENRRAKTGYAVLIDEGGHFRRREPVLGARWIDWYGGVSVHWCKHDGRRSRHGRALRTTESA